jgi:hypothetical protein
MPRCLVGMEACAGAHHLRRSAGARDRLEIVESDARLLLKRRPN